jgi:predicted O-methyltransferase YrrM
MSGITHDYIEKYIRSLIKESGKELLEMEEYAKENHVPIIHKEVGQFIELFINIVKPLRILELGTAIGYSSILMSRSAGTAAKITTIERDEKMVELALENIKKSGLDKNIEVLEGDCLEILGILSEKYDIIFMDAGKGHYKDFLPHCIRLMDKNGVIISDNVLFRGMIASDELVDKRKSTIVKRMREYLECISDSEEFITSVIPMGDGIAVTARRNVNE